MAFSFWGVEVKPGEPYIHRPGRGRLRITQALLGSHADVGWTILESNVGNMNPVRLCALNPMNHMRNLEIEFEERESVFLSVSGSSCIHLSGRIYNHFSSDDQAHTSNKLASKTKSPACLKRKYQGNEANENKEPSLKEPTVTKVNGKNDASKEPLINEAGGKNVASPKQPIVGEDDYSDDHVPIRIAYEKRMATRKESSVVQTVPIQGHEITQEKIVSKADGKNEASLEEPTIIEGSGKNVASPKQPIVSEYDHLAIHPAHKKRMPTRKRKNRTPGIGKVLSGQNNDYAILESSVAHTVPIQDHEIPQDIVTKADGNNEASPAGPVISEASGKSAASAKQPVVREDDYSDDHLPIRVAYEKRMATRKESSVAHVVPIQDHEILQDIVTKADGNNKASPEEPIISEASGKSAASAKQPIVGEDDDIGDHLPVVVAPKKIKATRKRKHRSPGMEKVLSDHNNDHKIMDSNVMHTMPTQDHEVTQDNISQLVGATCQSTRDDGFLFTGATNQHNSVLVEEFYKGDGKSTASNGSKVTVECVGKLLDGQIVDPMAIRKFRLGAGEVIPGWDAGVSGMRVGSKRKVTIPPALGHGNRAVGMIPANSWLIYEFELKKVRRTKKASKVSKNRS